MLLSGTVEHNRDIPGIESSTDSVVFYALSNFEIRCDVTRGRLCDLLRETLKRASAAIPYTTLTFYDNSPQIRNHITSNLEVGQRLYYVLSILIH